MSMLKRILSYRDAVREALDQEMAADSNVLCMGLDVDDHKGIQGSTLGLVGKYGPERVFGTPLSEDAMTGIAIGAAMTGLRPVHTHIRMDFMLLVMNQLINVASAAHYTYGGQIKVPLVVRCIIGKSWGQGAQHSKGLYSMFMNVPGLKVVAPSCPSLAKRCMLAAIRDDNPVIFVEHRLLYNTEGPVEEYEAADRPVSMVCCGGKDITIVAISSMVPQAIAAATLLEQAGIDAEVIDPVWLNPLDTRTIIASVSKTGALLVVDNGWVTCGAGAEIISQVAQCSDVLRRPVQRMGFAATPCPTAPNLEADYYPTASSIAAKVWSMLRPKTEPWAFVESKLAHEAEFKGPF